MGLAEDRIDKENLPMALYPQTTTNLALWPEPIEMGVFKIN